MIKGKQTRPSRICFECTHYEACQAWNVGTLVETDATHCVNYRASVEKTNADRIRSMSDEELAVFFAQQEYRKPVFDGWLPLCNHVMGPRTCHEDGCKKCWLGWLRQEASND